MTDTVPPQNLEAEESVLGAMMISPGAIGAVSELLDAADFYRESHAKVYRAALQLYAKGEPVDAITLGNMLEQTNELQAAGGQIRLHELANLVPASANAAHYARIVKETATLRGLIRAGVEISQLGWDRPGEAPELVERAEQIVFGLANNSQSQAVSLPVEVKRVYEELMALDGKPRDMLGVSSGLADLDRMTRGFRSGDLAVLAADTGRGKSALWLGTALHLAVTKGLPVIAFSLEMSETELVQRALSLLAGVPHDRLTRGDIRADEWRRVSAAAQDLWESPLSLWTDAMVRPAGIRSHMRQWKAKNPEGALAIVDYLQLLTPDDKTDNRTADVSAISRALKVTAMDIQVPILALSQFHRRQNPDDRPHRNNLRESGSIENDASLVLLLHRPDRWDTDPVKRGTAEIILAKNRHGAPGVCDVRWHPEQMRFSNLAHAAREAA